MTDSAAIANQVQYDYGLGIKQAEAMIDAFGGVRQATSEMGIQGAIAAQSTQAQQENLAKYLGMSRSDAAVHAARINALNQAAGIEGTERKVNYLGGPENFIETVANMELGNMQTQKGSMDGQRDKAAAVGKNLEGYSHWTTEGSIASEKDAEFLRKQGFNVGVGDSISYSLDKNGKLVNFSTSKHNENGAMSTVYNNNGEVAYIKEDGVFGGQHGTRIYDKDGNMITQNLTSGSNSTFYNDYTSSYAGSNITGGNASLLNAVMGNAKAVHDLGVFSNNIEIAQQMAFQSLSTLTIFAQKNAGNTTNVTAGLGAMGSSVGFIGQTSDSYNAKMVEGMGMFNDIYNNSTMTQGKKEEAWADYLGGGFKQAEGQYDKGAVMLSLDRASDASAMIFEPGMKYLAGLGDKGVR
jgi:hypothetical protein